MNWLTAWKKMLLFGLAGAIGCLAGWAVGELFLSLALKSDPATGQDASLVSRPTPPPVEAPPEDFRQRLEAAGAKSGDVQLSLIWDNTNDLDLHCVDPQGFEIYYPQQARRSPTGGELDVDRNAGCNPVVKDPVENIYWPAGGAPNGNYRVYVNYFQRCPGANDETPYKVNILIGSQRQQFSGTIRRADGKKLIHEFGLKPSLEVFAPSTVKLVPGKAKLPFVVRRSLFKGPVTVRVENLPPDVRSESVEVPEGKTEGELELTVGPDAARETRSLRMTASNTLATGTTEISATTAPATARSFSPWLVIIIGIWTSLLAIGLSIALPAAQNYYLGRPLFVGTRWIGVAAGGALAGFVSGALGQSLHYALTAIGAAGLGFVTGWILLGGLLGFGVSFVIPNLPRLNAGLAGLVGGLLGAIAFLIGAVVSDVIGRVMGGMILGFCVGAMVAAAEAAARRTWLQVRLGPREIIAVNLGPEPVAIGSDARQCAVWAKGAALVAARYWVREGRVVCQIAGEKQASDVVAGDTRVFGKVEVTVCTGAPAATPQAAQKSSLPVAKVLPPEPPPEPKPAPPPKPAPVAAKPVLAKPATTTAEPLPAALPVATAAGCPGCGRNNPGKPGARYCMVCDKTY